MVKAGIYARISSDREGDNLAVSRQLADCEQLAVRRGWKVVERYVDSDISAYSGKRRPEYQRLLDDVDAGAVEAVLVTTPTGCTETRANWRTSSTCASEPKPSLRQ
jgi:site-specific DNA recombinase